MLQNNFNSKLFLESDKDCNFWLESSPVCTKVVDLDFNLIYMSSAGITALGIKDIKPFYSKPYPVEIYPQPYRDEWQACFKQVKEGGKTQKHDVVAVSTTGKKIWYDTTFLPLYNAEGKMTSIMVISVDITDRKLIEEKAKQLNAKLEEANNQLKINNNTDFLTKVPNRSFYERRFSENISLAKRDGGYLAHLMIDIDNFKEYNDTYGHKAGDDALKKVAQAIAHALQRETDLVSRLGGEEFAVLLPNTNMEGAIEIAEKIRHQVVDLAIEHNRSKWKIMSVSIGVESLKGDELNRDDLYKHSDIALYMAKQSGKNRTLKFTGKV